MSVLLWCPLSTASVNKQLKQASQANPDLLVFLWFVSEYRPKKDASDLDYYSVADIVKSTRILRETVRASTKRLAADGFLFATHKPTKQGARILYAINPAMIYRMNNWDRV